MSLAIDINKISDVLLVDGWHDIKEGSFSIDSYEYLFFYKGDDATIVHEGGQSGVCESGFVFTDRGTDNCVAGPLTSILAIKVSSK